MSTREEVNHLKKYYRPTPALVDGLEKELQYLQGKIYSKSEGGKMKNARIQKAPAKRKIDGIERVFQAFVDVVFFLEFVENHRELHEIYEAFLKDLFGINIDDSSEQPHHYKNRSPSLFSRFISASLFSHSSEGMGFRVSLLPVIMGIAIQTIINRKGCDERELKLFGNNIENARLWIELFASRFHDEPTIARRRIGYCII